MQYELGVHYNGRTAKNKAIITGRGIGRCDLHLKLDAANDAEAYKTACSQILVNDPRPVAGKSYVRHGRIVGRQVGDRVTLLQSYYSCTTGVINEVTSPEHVCITLDGYHNPYVDFNINELV